MKKNIVLIAIVFIIFLSLSGVIIYKINSPQCKDLPCRNETQEEWRELSCELWISKDGDIAFKTIATREGGKVTDVYITETPLGEDIPLKSLVDTATFHYMGGSFYKDKNHIYNYMAMADGGNFYSLDSVDYSTFEILERGCYARDKKYIYRENHASVVEEADYETFRVIKGNLAKDKNGFILWGDRVTETEVKEYLKVLE